VLSSGPEQKLMNRRSFHRVLATAGSAVLGPHFTSSLPADQPDPGLPNVPLPTLGGMQFWADELFFHDWHIQRNVLTGHCRLLDGENIRHAWGTYEQCLARLEAVKREQGLPPMTGTAVVMLHGLIRSASNMRPLARYLKLQGGMKVFNINYPSTRAGIADHAAQLHRILGRLEGIEKIYLVAHSLGNIVIRHYWHEQTDAAGNTRPDPRIQRLVMVGPPNQGAKIAEILARNPLAELIFGPPSQEFAHRWDDLAPKLATPNIEFGILAGGRGDAKGYNPLLGEDNDLIVTVESAKLPGARDFLVLPVLHTFMMEDAAIKRATLSFLKHGYFRSPEQRQPL
jgi:pimeloyl-ACP methyl ester carboxylesterase